MPIDDEQPIIKTSDEVMLDKLEELEKDNQKLKDKLRQYQPYVPFPDEDYQRVKAALAKAHKAIKNIPLNNKRVMDIKGDPLPGLEHAYRHGFYYFIKEDLEELYSVLRDPDGKEAYEEWQAMDSWVTTLEKEIAARDKNKTENDFMQGLYGYHPIVDEYFKMKAVVNAAQDLLPVFVATGQGGKLIDNLKQSLSALKIND